MRALLLLLLAAPARAQDEAFERKFIDDIWKRVEPYTRNIREVSNLGYAGKLDDPVPFEPKVEIKYSGSLPRVGLGCPSSIEAGGQVATMVNCGGTALIGLGTDLWILDTVNGKYSPDRTAYTLAHELAHIRLAHLEQFGVYYDETYKKWYEQRGKHMKARFKEQEESRYKKVDRAEVDSAVLARLHETFWRQNEMAISGFSTRMEAEADEYAHRLAAAAGFDPDKVAGAYRQFGETMFLLENKDKIWFQKDEGRSGGGLKTHPSFEERETKRFEKAYPALR